MTSHTMAFVALFLILRPDVASAQIPESKAPGSQLLDAAKWGNGGEIQSLVRQGANIEVKGQDGETPLLAAIDKNRLDNVKLLLDLGANTRARDNSGNDALLYATRSLWLWRQTNPGHEDEIALYLLEKGADPNTRNVQGVTPLLYVAGQNDRALVSALLNKGADPNAKDNNGSTPLMEASATNNAEVVSLLLSKGADPNARGVNSNPALIQAVEANAADAVRLLIDHGAVVDIRDNVFKRTSLMFAAENGRVDLVSILLDKGADSALVDDSGRTAFMIAGESQQSATQQVLESHRGPRELIQEYTQTLRIHNPSPPRAVREKLIEIASGINPPLAVPDDARATMARGATLLKGSSDRSTLYSAVEAFQNAVDLAPWWPEAYFNYARALEVYGNYDEALIQMQFYLEFRLDPQDAADARQRMAVIQAEKETALTAGKKSQAEANLKYVSGGAQRVVDVPSWYSQGVGIGQLYAYHPDNWTSATDRNLANVFLMPDACYVSILIAAQPTADGSFSGDSIFVAVIRGSKVYGRQIPFGTLAESLSSGQCTYKVNVSERGPDAVVNVTDQDSGASVALPVRDLYAARLENIFIGGYNIGIVKVGGLKYWGSYQGGMQASVLLFSDAMVTARHSAAVDPMSFAPTWIIPLDHKDHALGTTKYFLRWQGSSWKITQ